MYSNKDLETIKKIILQQIETAQRIYLFGSYANDKADKESDLDIAILLSNKVDWKERKKMLNYLYQETSKNGIDVDFIVKTEDSFEKEKQLPTLAKVIYKEGKILWQTH